MVITDLDGSQSTITDNDSVEYSYDSNVNVYEFGNLILADIFPALGWFINRITDDLNSSTSVSDLSGSSSTITDQSGSEATIVDITGS